MAMLLAHVTLVLADIPVHCVQPEIIGKWRFHVGHWMVDGAADPMCGGTQPDEPGGHRELTPPYTESKPGKDNYFLSDRFKPAFSTEVLLNDWTSKVISTDGREGVAFKQNSTLPIGEWTMIYDEGFHVLMAQDDVHHSFFAFSKYMLGADENAGSIDSFANRKHSYCGMTLLGWYKQFNPQTGAIMKEGCWWGERIQPLHEALAAPGATHVVPPVLPVAPPSGKVPSKRAKPENSPSGGPNKQSPQPRADKEVPMPSAAVLRGMQDASTSILMRCMQVALPISILLTIFVAYKLYSGDKDGDKASVFIWRLLLVFGLLMALALAVTIWYNTSDPERPQPLKRMKPGKHNTIGEAVDAMHADVQAARQNESVVVRYQTDPEKLKAWVRERKERHGMDIDEHSSVVRLLDAISPPLKVGVPGFSTDQIIGPVKEKAIHQQAEIAEKLGIPPSELTVEDVKEHWTNGGTNHHDTRRFSMKGKELAPDGWKTLTDFDWREVSLDLGGGKTIKNFVNAVTDQGGCGSCYAVAATSMLTSRLMIKYPELHEKFAADRGADRISVKQQLSCNQYCQGCAGGYPYLIAKWSFENDIVTDKCMHQGHNSTGCPTTFTGPACQDRFRVKSWRYVGGALGRCGMHHLCEAGLREELYKGGPMTVSVEPGAGFGYADGVFHGVPALKDKGLTSEIHTAQDDKDCKGTECYIWRKVDHSVLLVGWGEDNSMGFSCQARVHKSAETDNSPDPGCEAIEDATLCRQKAECVYKGFPYWIIQNSYGQGFGREGYLYFGPRGQDPMFVESMTMAADVEWVKGFEQRQQASVLEARRDVEVVGATAPMSSNARAGRRKDNAHVLDLA